MCLRPKTCLTDEIINAYLGFLQVILHTIKKPSLLKSFEAHHYLLLSEVQTPFDEDKAAWTSDFPLDMYEYDKLIFPIFTPKSEHWSLAVIFPKEKRLWYLDSMNFDRPDVLKIIGQYYVDAMDWKYAMKVDLSEWEILQRKDIPQQKDNFSCGVFLLRFAQCLCKGNDLNFDPDEMSIFRRQIVLSLYDIDFRKPMKIGEIREGIESVRLYITSNDRELYERIGVPQPVRFLYISHSFMFIRNNLRHKLI